MPGGDRTGPRGEGPMTGRRLGYGAGYHAPGYMHGQGFGRGYGFHHGRGFGYGRRWEDTAWDAPASSLTSDDEVRLLKEETRLLRESLDAMMKRLDALVSADDKTAENESGQQ